MKKLVALMLALFMSSSFSFALAIGPTDEVQQKEEDFTNKAKSIVNRIMQEKGYVEVQRQAAVKNGVDSKTYELAHKDFDSASQEMKEEILTARQEIINSASWYDDSSFVYLARFDGDTGEWSELPKFSELFPGWEIPRDSVRQEPIAETDQAPIVLPSVSPRTSLFYGSVALKKASATTLASPFKTWIPGNNMYSFTATVRKLVTSAHCNLGLTDMSVTPNVSVGTAEELYVNGGFVGVCRGNGSRKVGFRASTYSAPGSATISIDYNIE